MRWLYGACVGEEAGARNRVFVFPYKVTAAGDERYLVRVMGPVAVGLFFLGGGHCNGGFKLLWKYLSICNYRYFEISDYKLLKEI